MTIDSFTMEHFFLSNFYPCDIEFRGVEYASSEHAYQAAKTDDPEWKERITQAITPGRCKKVGRQAPLRATWEDEKIDVMREVLRAKFGRYKGLRTRLLATYPHELIEGNDWGDRFWGTVKGKGDNWLGKLLMELRDELRAEEVA